MKKRPIFFAVLIITLSVGLFNENASAAAWSVYVCGYTVVKNHDGTWTVGNTTYSSGYTLQDIKDELCR